MSCKVTYIEQEYRENYPKLADRLTDIHNQIFEDVKKSKLFRQYGDGPTPTFLFSGVGTEANKKQISFIKELNKKYNTPEGYSVISSKPTKAGNNTKILVNIHPLAQQEYYKLNPQLRMFQITGTEGSRANAKTLATIKDFLKRIGVDVKSVKNIVVNGVRMDANAAAQVTQKLIQVVEGMDDVALTEEAMHFAVEIIEQTNPSLFNKLLKEVNDYNLLNEVIATYGTNPLYQTEDGKPDIRKLKKEAIGKILSETIINKSEGYTERPELTEKTLSWWKQMIEWFKGLFSQSGFDQAAMDIISGKNIGTADDIRSEEGETFLQQNKQEAAYNKIKQVSKNIEKKGEDYYINGKKIGRRVTSLVKDWYERRFKAKDLIKSDYQKAVDDLKAEKGTAGHADMEHAFNVLVDENGFLRETPLDDSNYKSRLNPTDNSLYKVLRDNLEQRLNSFPEGTRFMSEVTVHDAKRDIAGTIDLLAIEPDGKTNILDWKFMDLYTEKYKDIPWYKVSSWQLQMDNYKYILNNAYGVRNEDFKQTRMIPIKATYEFGDARNKKLPILTDVEIGDVNVKNIQKAYLIPVGLEGEFTGNDEVDALLKKLNDEYRKISEKKVLPSQKLEKAEQLNKLFSAIRQLQMRQNISPLIEQAKLLNKQATDLINKFNQEWKDKDPNSFTDKQVSDFAEDVDNLRDVLRTYADLDIDLESIFDLNMTEEDEKLKEDLSKTAANSKSLLAKMTKLENKFGDEIIGKRQGVDKLSTPEKIVKGLSRWFGSTATIQLRALETLYKLANRALGFATMEAYNENKKLADLKSRYDAWAASKGLTKKDYFKYVKKSGKNELIDEFNSEFYSELRKKVGDKDQKWITENVDTDAFRKFMAEKLEDEYRRIEEKPRIETDEALNKIITIEKAQAKLLFDTSTSQSAGWLQYEYLAKFPNRSKWESKEWKELNAKGNEPAKEFYNYIRERNDYYREIGYISAKDARVFLPWIRQSLTERMIFGGNAKLGEQFLRSISVDDGDIGYGKINPHTGEIIDSLPAYFTTELEGDVSEDLFKNMGLLNDMAIRFAHLKTIEGQVRAIGNIEKNKQAIRTSVFGKTIYKDGKLEYTPDNNDNAKLVEAMIKTVIYNQKYIESENFDQLLGKLGNFGENLNKKLGIKVFPENLKDRQISLNKSVDWINRAFQLKTLGLNPLSALSNFLGGNFQSIINAGTYFTKTDFMSTEMWMLSKKMMGGPVDAKTALAAMEYFLPLTENYSRETGKKLTINKLSGENAQDVLMWMMRKSDVTVQYVNFFSYLKNTAVIDGKLVNAREYLRNQEKYQNRYNLSGEERAKMEREFDAEVGDILEKNGVLKVGKLENGTFVIPGVDQMSQSVIELRRKVQQISKDALGNMSDDDKRMINAHIYGNSFMVFKNWIPRQVDVRFGNLKYNSASDAYEWGRMRTITRVITTDLVGSINNLISAIKANEKGVEFLRKLYEEKKADYERETGKELKMTEAQFMDLVRKNIQSSMYDVAFMLSLYGIFLALKAVPPDDDEDPRVKNQYKFMLRVVDKVKDEVLYFYDPTSVQGLISTGFFPSMDLLENTKKLVINFGKETYAVGVGDTELQEKNYVVKYLLRTFPITSQASAYLPMFYPDMAKDLGIKAQSSSGFIR